MWGSVLYLSVIAGKCEWLLNIDCPQDVWRRITVEHSLVQWTKGDHLGSETSIDHLRNCRSLQEHQRFLGQGVLISNLNYIRCSRIIWDFAKNSWGLAQCWADAPMFQFRKIQSNPLIQISLSFVSTCCLFPSAPPYSSFDHLQLATTAAHSRFWAII